MEPPAPWLLVSGLVLSVLPWLAGPGGFETAKLIWLAATLLITLLFANGQIKMRQPILSGLVAATMVYLAVRGTIGDASATAWLGTLVNPLGIAGWWIIGCLVLVVINLDWPLETSEIIRKLVIISGLLLAVAALIQWRTGFGIDWQTYDDPGRRRLIFSTIGTPGQLGIVAALLASFLIEPLRRRSSLLTKIAILALAVVVITSGSITGLVLLVIAVGWHWLAKIWRPTGAVIITGLALGVFIIGSLNSAALNRWPSLADRAVIWQSAWQSAADQPWFGFGPSHFQVAYDHHYPARRLTARAITEERAHNWPLEIQVELGLIGLLLVVSVLYGMRRYLSWTDHWLPAWLWLLATWFNPVIVPVAALGILALIQPAARQTSPRAVPVGSLGRTVMIALAIGLAWVALTPVRATLVADRANAYSTQGEFGAAVVVTSRSFRIWPTQPQLYLVAAEAATNFALKQGLWTDSEAPAIWLEQAVQQLPGSNSAATAAKIGRLWQQHQAPEPIWAKVQFDFLKIWADQPRQQELVRILQT